MSNEKREHSHFHGKDALSHLQEVRQDHAKEIHGNEAAGPLAAALDTAKELSVAAMLGWVMIIFFASNPFTAFILLLMFLFSWLTWKVGRSAWMAWSRLERLHRIMEQERHEIEHHREQEREELRALYSGKGFQGQLLEDVCDVLMADEDRLLHVMLTEEMGFKVGCYEHPLKYACGSFIGGIITIMIVALTVYLFPPFVGVFLGGFIAIAVASGVRAKVDKNRLIPAIVWNVSIAALAVLVTGFIISAVIN